MQRWKLIICFTNRTWTTDYVEASETEDEELIHQKYLEQYIKNMVGDSPDIAYIGTYHVEENEETFCEDRCINQTNCKRIAFEGCPQHPLTEKEEKL